MFYATIIDAFGIQKLWHSIITSSRFYSQQEVDRESKLGLVIPKSRSTNYDKGQGREGNISDGLLADHRTSSKPSTLSLLL